jgi:hypothetical protein
MRSMVIDVLHIKTIQKIIRRSLSPIEIETLRVREPIFVQDKNGTWYSFRVRQFKLPHDLTPSWVTIDEPDTKKTAYTLEDYLDLAFLDDVND